MNFQWLWFVVVLQGLSMVSMQHEVMVELFKNRPSLATELLAESLDVSQPTFDEARLASIELTDVQPAEYRVDVVIVLYRNEKPIRVNIVEVQLGVDPNKSFVWPVYLTLSRDKHRCKADLLVIAPDPAVATWCSRPIEIGVEQFVLKPPVLYRDLIPKVTDPDEAARRPELALLSAMAYGDSDQAQEIAEAALSAFAQLDDKRSGFYQDILYNSINEAARRALEAKMKGYEYTSPFALKHIALGRDEGIKLGRDEGIKLGRDEGVARSLLTVLDVRGIDVPDATRQRILEETDTVRLERWLKRAVTARSLAEVLAEPS
jgi:hypothetical protein